MNYEYITGTVKRLQQKYGETDPFRLCKAMKIIVAFEPLGTGANACKGFFIYKSQKKHITINESLPKSMQRIICAHELGHAVLHCGLGGVCAFHDFGLFDMKSQYEYEANVFAAESLLPNEDILEKLNEDTSFFGAADALQVPIELLDFKFRVLKRQGYQFNSPICTNADFLKSMEVMPDDVEY